MPPAPELILELEPLGSERPLFRAPATATGVKLSPLSSPIESCMPQLSRTLRSRQGRRFWLAILIPASFHPPSLVRTTRWACFVAGPQSDKWPRLAEQREGSVLDLGVITHSRDATMIPQVDGADGELVPRVISR